MLDPIMIRSQTAVQGVMPKNHYNQRKNPTIEKKPAGKISDENVT